MRIQKAREQGNSTIITLTEPQRRLMGIVAGEYVVTEVVGDLFVMVKHDKYKEALTEPNLRRVMGLLIGGELK